MQSFWGRFLQWPLVISVAAITTLAVSFAVLVRFVIGIFRSDTFPLISWLFPAIFTPLVITPIVATTFILFAKRSEELRRMLAEAMERERLLAGEMRHRIKNLYAVTLGLVSLAEREVSADERAKVPDILRQKLAALARASDATFTPEHAGEGVAGSLDCGQIIRSVLEPYGRSVQMSGETSQINAGSMTTLALCLHEMATNSVKYGALGVPSGTVHVVWSMHDSQLCLHWTEEGGPAIEQRPAHSGFGSAVIERFVNASGGAVRYNWQKSGLRVEVDLPQER